MSVCAPEPGPCTSTDWDWRPPRPRGAPGAAAPVSSLSAALVTQVLVQVLIQVAEGCGPGL